MTTGYCSFHSLHQRVLPYLTYHTLSYKVSWILILNWEIKKNLCYTLYLSLKTLFCTSFIGKLKSPSKLCSRGSKQHLASRKCDYHIKWAMPELVEGQYDQQQVSIFKHFDIPPKVAKAKLGWTLDIISFEEVGGSHVNNVIQSERLVQLG